MAGTKIVTEGLVGLVCESAEISGSNILNSVEGIDITSIQDRATCYVRDTDLTYRFFEDSVAAPAPPAVILPAGITVGDPGRWILQGGGAGAVETVVGSNGISTTNPNGPVVTVNGIALYARNGSNGAMTADVDMGLNSLTNVTIITAPGPMLLSSIDGILLSTAAGPIELFSGTTVALRGGGADADQWPTVNGTAGQVLAIQSVGSPNILEWVDQGGGGGSLQSAYNGGNTILTAGGLPVAITEPGDSSGLTVTSAGVDATPLVAFDATGRQSGPSLRLTHDPTLGSALDIVGGDYSHAAAGGNFIFGTTGLGSASFDVGDTFSVERGGSSVILIDNTTLVSVAAGRMLTWNGTQNEYVDPTGGSITMQVSALAAVPVVAAPAANSMVTWLLTNPVARTLILPAAAPDGARITVKEAANNAAPIAVTVQGGANIDFAAAYNIATIGGAATFQYETSTNQWWVI